MIDAHFVLIAGEKLHVSHLRIFALSQQWSENFHSKEWTLAQFRRWDKRGEIEEHSDLEDFILDVMNGKVQPEEIPR